MFLLLLYIYQHGFDLAEGTSEVKKWQCFLLVERARQTHTALTNAQRYAPQLKQIFREEGTPEDLIWLALIESGFRPDAHNVSGACGMFQFKQETARAFGLKVNKRVDERYMPYLAAQASARYLNYLRKKFDSWELVLAAYNLGEGDLRRAMAQHQAKSWLEVRRYVREETRGYVNKVKAAALVGNQYLEHTTDQEIQEESKAQHYFVKKGDTLWNIAQRFQTDISELKRINSLTGNTIVLGQRLLLP